MKVNKLQKGTTVIEIDNMELGALQEMLRVLQSYNHKLKEKDRLNPRHHDFINHLTLQLDKSNQKLIATDRHALKDKLRDALHKTPEREKGSYDYYYHWEIVFNPERDFDLHIDCRYICLRLSIGPDIYNSAHLQIAPHDFFADSKYINLDHSETVVAALAGMNCLRKFLKDILLASSTVNVCRYNNRGECSR